MISQFALSSAAHVSTIADAFFIIADALHKRLNTNETRILFAKNSSELYHILFEEYGLRARAAILQNNVEQHVINNSKVTQDRLQQCLATAALQILSVRSVEELRLVISGVNTLCVGISPGKGNVVDFLIEELENNQNSFSVF